MNRIRLPGRPSLRGKGLSLLILCAALTFVLCAGLGLLYHQWLRADRADLAAGKLQLTAEPTIPNGVFIETIPVGNLTYEEAEAKLESLLSTSIERLTVTVRYGAESYLFRLKENMVSTNLDDVLYQAMQLGGNLEGGAYSAYIEALPYHPVKLHLTRQIDPSPLEESVRALAQSLSVPPRDACFLSFDPLKAEGQRFTYQAETIGSVVDADRLWEKVKEEFLHREDGYVVAVAEEVEPSIRLADLERTNSKLASFSVSLPNNVSDNYLTNMQKVASAMTGIILQSGDIFSWNATLGEMTPDKGYVNPDMFSGRLASSVLYNAALLADLDVIERWPWGQMAGIRLGCEADVAYGSKDLKLINHRSSYVIFVMTVNRTGGGAVLTAEIYGMPESDELHVSIQVTQEEIPIPSGVVYIADEKVERGKTIAVSGRVGYRTATYRIYGNASNDEIRREILYSYAYDPIPKNIFYNPLDGPPSQP